MTYIDNVCLHTDLEVFRKFDIETLPSPVTVNDVVFLFGTLLWMRSLDMMGLGVGASNSDAPSLLKTPLLYLTVALSSLGVILPKIARI